MQPLEGPRPYCSILQVSRLYPQHARGGQSGAAQRVRAAPRTILRAKGLSRDAKLLYGVLLSYAWQAGSCFPGYERLQQELDSGKNQVTKYMQELERAQLISRRRRGLGKTNIYTLHDLPAPAAPTVRTNPAGALVRAIRDEWAPPQAWLDTKEHEVAIARQAEEEAARRAEEEERRRRWEAMTPEERVQGPLVLWLARQKLHGRQPTPSEIAARQAALIAQLAQGAGGVIG